MYRFDSDFRKRAKTKLAKINCLSERISRDRVTYRDKRDLLASKTHAPSPVHSRMAAQTRQPVKLLLLLIYLSLLQIIGVLIIHVSKSL